MNNNFRVSFDNVGIFLFIMFYILKFVVLIVGNVCYVFCLENFFFFGVIFYELVFVGYIGFIGCLGVVRVGEDGD